MDQAGDRPADDFTVLPGIGSAINRRLHDAGVGSFGALSELDIDRLAELLAGIPSVSRRTGSATRTGSVGQRSWPARPRSAACCRRRDRERARARADRCR